MFFMKTLYHINIRNVSRKKIGICLLGWHYVSKGFRECLDSVVGHTTTILASVVYLKKTLPYETIPKDAGFYCIQAIILLYLKDLNVRLIIEFST